MNGRCNGGRNGNRSALAEATITKADHDAALVAAFKAGDFSAFEELVNRYERKVFRLGMSLTGNREDAEDVMQNTFLKCFEHLGKFLGASSFSTWLTRIAVNEGLMKLRQRRAAKLAPLAESAGEEGEFIPREIADWRSDPEQLLSQIELQKVLERALETLTASRRAVFFLRDVEGFSTEEVADILNLTVGAAKAHLHRARLQLREDLTKVFRREVWPGGRENVVP